MIAQRQCRVCQRDLGPYAGTGRPRVRCDGCGRKVRNLRIAYWRSWRTVVAAKHRAALRALGEDIQC